MANDETGLGANGAHLVGSEPLADKWTDTTTPSRVFGGVSLTDSPGAINIDLGAIAQKVQGK